MSDKTIAQSSTSLDAVERRNPFPGLRSFKYEESHLYFGRDNQIEIVLNKLVQHRFVAVVGTSGIGKSSFLYCGLFPTLFGDYQTDYSNKWEIFTFRPGESPIKNLAQSITNEAVKNNPELDPEMTFNVEYSTLTSSSMGLVDAFRGKFDKYQKNYLIFVDQFEELFRFKDIDTNTTEETLAFIKLLLTATEQSEVPVYVALTMRSDFIGDCSQYPNLTNAINKSQFLIPQMTRNEKKAAVEGPVRVMGADIDERLVQQILNDVGDNADQLPIMQHALMRTWDYWEQSAIHNEPISTGHYEAIGGMKTALEVHANEAFNELNDEQKKLCERIFKTITIKGDDGRRIRRPTKLSEIAAIAERPIEDCIAVIDNFRRADRTLLMPPQEVPLTEDSVIDISHESLMRIW
ncbi:MAG TPA: High-affnity carbon uptake protein Hat/HatR, partial [Microscillaceae bacterium]|nr:High-affnity carbon uptake protein Hat/HatR [Microscillaceae bacterium]